MIKAPGVLELEPPGSPGMEVGDRKDPYKVFLIDRQGKETVRKLPQVNPEHVARRPQRRPGA